MYVRQDSKIAKQYIVNSNLFSKYFLHSGHLTWKLEAALLFVNFRCTKTKVTKTLIFFMESLVSVLKFGFSEKATKFEKIFLVFLTRASCSVRATVYLSKSRRRFFFKVDKSYYTNFTSNSSEHCLSFHTNFLKQDLFFQQMIWSPHGFTNSEFGAQVNNN